MTHKDVLKLLFPIELSGDFDKDIELEGGFLDAAQERVEDLLKEIFVDQSYELIADWERVCGLTPNADDTMQIRRERIINKIRERGGLSRAYFIDIISAFGYIITIEEYMPFMAGCGRAGDAVYTQKVIYVWRVKAPSQTLYYFRAGQSAAGERLLWWPNIQNLEDIMNELKPAHTYIVFNYS